MTIISEKYKHKLQFPKFVTPLESIEPDNESYVPSTGEVSKQNVLGIEVPLVAIGDTIIETVDVISVVIRFDSFLPSCTVHINDSRGWFKSLTKPTLNSNDMHIQLIPKVVDGEIVKKVIPFYITSFQHAGEKDLYVTGVYKLPALYESRCKSFGEITTLDLFDKIATECQLGFSTNCNSVDDSRLIYVSNKSYIDLLQQEVLKGGSQNCILQAWVDWNNNLNLINILDRYNIKDAVDDMKVHITTNLSISSGENKLNYQVVTPQLSNHPSSEYSQLYFSEYYPINNRTNSITEGSDIALMTCTMYGEYEDCDYLVEDGEAENNIFKKYVYVGEKMSEKNRIEQPYITRFIHGMINSECIDVVLKNPILDLERGSQVILSVFEQSPLTRSFKDLSNPQSNVDEFNNKELDEETQDPSQFVLNKMYSGQYMVLSTTIEYNKADTVTPYKYKLRLTRPRQQDTVVNNI